MRKKPTWSYGFTVLRIGRDIYNLLFRLSVLTSHTRYVQRYKASYTLYILYIATFWRGFAGSCMLHCAALWLCASEPRAHHVYYCGTGQYSTGTLPLQEVKV